MKYLEMLAKAVAAGVMIAIGGMAYVACENKMAGAVFFCVGLLAVCMYGMNLFTGKVGYLVDNRPRYLIDLLIIWAGNFIGANLVGQLVKYAKPAMAATASTMCETKLSQNPLQTLILGFFCGVLMYVAVDNFRRNPSGIGKYLGILFCVPGFIIAGFEHSIADMAYFALADQVFILSGRALWFLLLVTVGNTLGGVFLPLLFKIKSGKGETK